MKDIPAFTTENGAASLVLKEIAYQGKAYFIIRDSLSPEELIKECVDFCCACGAEEIYGSGHVFLERWPFYTSLVRMRGSVSTLMDTDAALWPVQETTAETWREIYNSTIKRVPNAAWMTRTNCQRMVEKGTGYFVHRGEELLGIGMVDNDTIEWICAVKDGCGRDVLSALSHAIVGDTVLLTVATRNERAVRFYEKNGFIKVSELSRWYRLK